jgi:ammonium transporter, Amt family
MLVAKHGQALNEEEPIVPKRIVTLLVLLLCVGFAAVAEETTLEQAIAAIDMMWIIVAASLVFFMQAGFALVETGLTRAKNATNIIMKNLMDFCIGSLAFWMIGWGLMYGADGFGGLFGFSEFFKGPMDEPVFYRNWFFQVVFAATAATIVSGAMAERTQFKSYLIYTFFISAIIYPVSGHWIWGGGWLAGLGFHDFAGSTVVHSVGGWAAFMGAWSWVRGWVNMYVPTDRSASRPCQATTFPWPPWVCSYCGSAGMASMPGSTLSGMSTDIARVAATTTLAASAEPCPPWWSPGSGSKSPMHP